MKLLRKFGLEGFIEELGPTNDTNGWNTKGVCYLPAARVLVNSLNRLLDEHPYTFFFRVSFISITVLALWYFTSQVRLCK